MNFCGIEVTLRNGVIRAIGPDPARRDMYHHGICPKGVSGAFPKMTCYADAMMQTLAKLRKTVAEHGITGLDLNAYAVAFSPFPTRAHGPS